MIDVEGVTVRLGDATVLDAVTATVGEGRFVGLVGPNGAGKTTLLRAINGRITPVSGGISVGGERVAELGAREIGRRVATVPQDTSLSFEFDVRDVVEMGRHPHRSRLSVGDPGNGLIDRALERTGTADLADRAITAVSGGERQRVLLARALAQDTPVLLLDEPTASLDVNHQVRTLELVRGLVDGEGKTVLAAIHDLDLAARYCDDLFLLHDGGIEASGPPEAVLTGANLRTAFDTDVAVGRDPVIGTPTVTALPERTATRGVHVHVVCGGGSGIRLLYPLVAAGFEVSVGAVHEGDPDLAAADLLELEAVTAPAFTPFDDEVAAAAKDAARRADATVLADVDVGPANDANLAVAAAGDRLVVVEERPFEARNRAGDAARRRYERLCERGRVVDPDGVVDAVIAELEGTQVLPTG